MPGHQTSMFKKKKKNPAVVLMETLDKEQSSKTLGSNHGVESLAQVSGNKPLPA